MKVRAVREGVLNGHVIAAGHEFELATAPVEWFDKGTGWLELVNPGDRIRREARTLFLNESHPLTSQPRTLRQVQDELDNGPPEAA